MKELEKLMQEIINFRDNRDWKKYHNTKDISISLSLEASELLENFQWLDSEEALKANRDSIVDEMADVFIYLMLLSNEISVDLIEATKSKIEKNKAKYPIDKVYGEYKKYTELEE